MKLFEPAPYMPPLARYAAAGWLSFLMAGVATGVFFSMIDPDVLAPCVPFPPVSRTAAYSIGFLLFWLLCMASSMLAIYFTYPGDDSDTDASDGATA